MIMTTNKILLIFVLSFTLLAVIPAESRPELPQIVQTQPQLRKNSNSSSSNPNWNEISSSAPEILPPPEFETAQQPQTQSGVRQGKNGYVDIVFSPFDPLSRLASLFMKGMHFQFAPTTKRPLISVTEKPHTFPGSTWPHHPPTPGQYPYPGSHYPGQQYPGQMYPYPYPGQMMYPMQPYPGQMYPGAGQGQPYPGQVYPGQQYPGGVQPYPGQTHAGQMALPIQNQPGQLPQGTNPVQGQQQPYPGQQFPGTTATGQQPPTGPGQPFPNQQPQNQFQQSTSQQSQFATGTGNPPPSATGTVPGAAPLYPPSGATAQTQYAPNQQYPNSPGTAPAGSG